MKTVLYSSTRQWNPGDEFVFYGVRRLINAVLGAHNCILFNRHPYIIERERPLVGTTTFFDNSWMPGGPSPDYIVLSGPEWNGSACRALYSLSEKKNVPLVMVGVGCRADISKAEARVLASQCVSIAARDHGAFESLSGFGAIKDACPGIFVSDIEIPKKHKKYLAISFQGPEYCCSPNINQYNLLKEIWHKLISEFRVTLICHTYVDFAAAKKDFPDANIYYSSWSEDYLDAYKEFDIIVGTRLHAAALAVSFGIPAVLARIDKRAEAAVCFGIPPVSPENLIKTIESIDVESESRRLIDLKRSKFKSHEDRLRGVFCTT